MTFWLPDLEEAAPKLRSNAARSGDADYKAPSQTKADNIGKRVAKERKKAGKGGSKYDESKHRRGGKGTREGGRFVSSSSGSSPSQVKTVQDQLGVAQTGVYDAGTAATVIAFQKRHGLQVDGIIGRQTALALTGQYERARKVGPGALGPETSKLTGGDSSPGPSKRRKRSGRGKTSGSRSRARSGRGGASGERVRGGAVIDGLAEVSPPPDPFVSEGVVDALGNVHDKLGKFSEKLGAKGAKATGNPAAAIPEYDASALTFGKSAGGSNGARLASTKQGEKWLVKTYGGSENRVATELLSNAVYREAGARVPRAGRIRLHNGKQGLAYPLLEGKPKPMVFQRRGAKPSAEVGEHFMTDALLANWDVAGLADDNILWDAQGQPFRVDQGGTLEYRAMGQRKDFGPVPYEVTTLLRPGGQGRRSALVSAPDLVRQARDLHDRLTPAKIDKLVDAAGFKDEKMRERVRRALKGRVDWMGKFAAGQASFPTPPPKGKVQEDAAWLLLESPMVSFAWDESLHPRDVHGQFIKKLGGLKAGSNQSIQLDSKTYVKRDKDGSFRVVRAGGITKGFATAPDAARAALDKSAKSTETDSLGGNVKHKDFNAYLESRGVGASGVDLGAQTAGFGGEHLTGDQLADEAFRLAADLAKAKGGDKYEQRRVPTVKARMEEATAKAKKLGGKKSSPAQSVDAVKSSIGLLIDPGEKMPFGKYTVTKTSTGYDVLHKGSGQTTYYADIGNAAHAVATDKHAPGMPDPNAGTFVGEHGKGTFPSGAPSGAPGTTYKGSMQVPAGTVVNVKLTSKPGYNTAAYLALGGGKFHMLNNDGHPVGQPYDWSTGKPLGYELKAVQHPSQVIKDTQAALDKIGINAETVKPKAKPIKGPQANTLTVPGFSGAPMPARLKHIDLAAGDVLQKAKGGWKYTVLEPEAGHNGTYVKVIGPNGASKFWPGHSQVGLIEKQDGSALQLKEGAGTAVAQGAAPAAPSPAALTPEQISAKLQSGSGLWASMSDLKDGAVFETPAGQIGVLAKSEDAYTGYLAAYDIKTGAKFEPHATNYAPHKASQDPSVMAAAKAQLAKVKAGATAAPGTPAAKAAPPPPPKQVHTTTSLHPSWGGAALSGKQAEVHLHGQQPSLSSQAKQAMKDYTDGGYGVLNGGLRKGDLTASQASTVMAMDQAYHDLPALDVDVVTHRGAALSDFHGKIEAGKIIQDLGYMSTSPTNPWDREVQLHMRIRAGTKVALWVDNFSYHGGEREAVVKRGAVMHVLQVEMVAGKTHVYVDVVG